MQKKQRHPVESSRIDAERLMPHLPEKTGRATMRGKQTVFHAHSARAADTGHGASPWRGSSRESLFHREEAFFHRESGRSGIPPQLPVCSHNAMARDHQRDLIASHHASNGASGPRSTGSSSQFPIRDCPTVADSLQFVADSLLESGSCGEVTGDSRQIDRVTVAIRGQQ